MAYSRITGTRNGAGAIDYARGKGKGHNNKKVRNMVIGEVNLLPKSVAPYEEQMQRYWNKASVKNKNQVRRIVQSFSRKELNPDDPADIQLANEIGIEFAQRAYPGHQAVVFTQIDGESGLIHNHVLVNNVNMQTGYGCSDEQTKFQYVKWWTNKVAGQYFELDKGQHTHDKVTQNERRKRQENEKIREENKSLPPEKQKKLKYIWKDDLKERISRAADVAYSREYFLILLEQMDVSAEIRQRKDGTEYIVYTLNDEEKRQQENAVKEWKAKGHKLGADYDLESLDKRFSKAMDKMGELFYSTDEEGKNQLRSAYDVELPGMLADTDKSEFGYIVPKEHVKQTVDVKVEKKPVKRKVEKPEAEKTESPVTEKSSVKQEEKKPLLWGDYIATQPEQERFESPIEELRAAMNPKAKHTEKEPEEVPEKAVAVKRSVETTDEAAKRRRMAVMQAQKSNQARKVQAHRSAFQKDKRPLPDLSHIDWSKGNGNSGLEF